MSNLTEKCTDRLDQFVSNGDGTVTDVLEGLIWMSERETDKVGLSKALTIAMRKDFAGYTDWRLPTFIELKSIGISGYLNYFKKPVAGYYWSCTKLNTLDSYDSWHMIINSMGDLGAGNPITGLEYVRLVRFAPRFAVLPLISGSGSGIINISVCNGDKKHNSEVDGYIGKSIVTLTAHPAIGSKFKQWQGSLRGLDQICTLTVEGETKVTAEFEQLGYSLNLNVIGSGCITRSVEAQQYLHGTTLSLTAVPDKGSQFKRWKGHASGSDTDCVVEFDTEKTITAEFVRIFPLTTKTSGNGIGHIERSADSNFYIEDSDIWLTAVPARGSKFVSWHGDANARGSTCLITLNSAKTVCAEFIQLEKFALTVVATGSGAGEITRSLDAKKYIEGTEITLTASANEGSTFKRWYGAASGRGATCTVTLDSAKSVSAEFVQLESYSLEITSTGTGMGRVQRNIDLKTYFSGSSITLSAQAEEGSIFNGWHGDAAGLDDVCTVTMNSAISIGAEFEKMTISDTSITAELESAGRKEIKKGQLTTIFYLTLHSKAEQQVRVKVPLTSYVRRSGQTSEQNSWTAELVNGSKGVTLSAGAFCEMGLVYFMEPKKGDKLYVNVEQVSPSLRICFTFQCISVGNLSTFQLVNASLDDQKEAAESRCNLQATASVLKRIESLEGTLAEVLRRLDALQGGFPRLASNAVFKPPVPAQTFPEVLAWLAEHDRIAVAEFRARLLPLDLLPSAIINEINETALDRMNELALEEVGDEIVVTREILDKVIANWNAGES